MFTEQFGLVHVLARGARKSARRFASGLPAFAVLQARLSSGTAELRNLQSASMDMGYPTVLGDLEWMRLLGSAWTALRTLLAPHQPEPELFQSCVDLLQVLNSHTSQELPERDRNDLLSWRLCSWLVHVLGQLGQWPDLEKCATCGRRARPDQSALMDSRSGGLRCRSCGGGSVRLAANLRAKLMAPTFQSGFKIPVPELSMLEHVPLIPQAVPVVRTVWEHATGKPLTWPWEL